MKFWANSRLSFTLIEEYSSHQRAIFVMKSWTWEQIVAYHLLWLNNIFLIHIWLSSTTWCDEQNGNSLNPICHFIIITAKKIAEEGGNAADFIVGSPNVALIRQKVRSLFLPGSASAKINRIGEECNFFLLCPIHRS